MEAVKVQLPPIPGVKVKVVPTVVLPARLLLPSQRSTLHDGGAAADILVHESIRHLLEGQSYHQEETSEMFVKGGGPSGKSAV